MYVEMEKEALAKKQVARNLEFTNQGHYNEPALSENYQTDYVPVRALSNKSFDKENLNHQREFATTPSQHGGITPEKVSRLYNC